MTKKILAVLICVLMVAGVFAGCKQQTSTTPAEKTAAAQAPKATDAPKTETPVTPTKATGPDGRTVAESQVYRTLYSGEVSTMNYLSTGTTNDLVVGANTIDWLVEPDSYGQIQPGLAESWKVSEDGLTWTFKIRKGVYWYDYQGNKMDELTAHDFVAALRYVCDAVNDCSNSYLVEDWVVNASEYWAYTDAVMSGTKPEVEVKAEDIGVVAVDDYTLEYHLCIPRSYFVTALQFGPYWPAPAKLLEEYGADFATDNTKMWFCGAYILSDFAPQSKRVYTKNENYWDAEHVYIEKIEQTYNSESGILAPEMFLRGDVDYSDISAELLDEWRADPEKKDYVAPTRVEIDYSYFFCFNFEPRFDEQYEPANWSIVVNNENFRKAIFHGLDRVRAMQVIYPENAEDLIENTVTPKTFAVNGDKDFTTYGDLAKFASTDSFNETLAKEYFEKAKSELTAAGAKFPIKIPLPYNSGSSSWGSECVVIEQQLETLFGKDFIDVIVVAGPSSGFLGSVRRTGDYALLKCNWGADYADPETWTDPFTDPNSYNFAFDTTEKFGVNTKTEETMSILKNYWDLVALAKAEYTDIDKRYELFANAEAYYIEHAIIIPFGVTGGDFEVSRLNVFEGQYSSCGQATSRYKGQKVYEEPMSTEMFEEQFTDWQAAMGLK